MGDRIREGGRMRARLRNESNSRSKATIILGHILYPSACAAPLCVTSPPGPSRVPIIVLRQRPHPSSNGPPTHPWIRASRNRTSQPPPGFGTNRHALPSGAPRASSTSARSASCGSTSRTPAAGTSGSSAFRSSSCSAAVRCHHARVFRRLARQEPRVIAAGDFDGELPAKSRSRPMP